MPEKDGDESKSTKSVVNKRQKQMMNTEEFSDRQRSDMKDILNKNFGSEDKSKETAGKLIKDKAKKDVERVQSGKQPNKATPSTKLGRSKVDLNKYFGEEGYDIARDMGKVRPSKDKKDATTMSVSDEVKKTQKVVKGPSAFERVKAKYGKSVMNVGKKKVKEELDLTKVAEAFGGYIIEANGRSKGGGARSGGGNQNRNQNTRKNPPTGNNAPLLKNPTQTIQGPGANPDEYTDTMRKNIERGRSVASMLGIEDPKSDPTSRYDYDQLSGKEKEEYMNIKREVEGSKRQKPPITGDSGQRDRPRVTFGQGQEPKKRAPRKGVDYFFDPKKAKAERERTAAKRKEYGIDDKGNVTDAGVEKFARKSLSRKQQASGSNVPIELSKSDLDTAREKLVGGKEVKDSKGKVIGKTTGKYGGTMSPQASEKEMKQTQAYLKKRGLTKSFTGDKPPSKDDVKPKKDTVTVNTTDTEKVATPKPESKKGVFSTIKKFAKDNPVTALATYDLGKGILGKLMKVKGAIPGVVGGTVGRRSARGGGGL